MGENGRPQMPPMGENGRPQMPPMGENGNGAGAMPPMPSMSENAAPQMPAAEVNAAPQNATPVVERPLTDTEKITAEINARRQAEAQKQAAASQQAKEQAQEAEKIPVSTTSTLKPTNGTQKKASKLKVIIIGIIIVLAIIILGSCMLKSCAKKVDNVITNGGNNNNTTNVTDSGTSLLDLTPTQTGFSWTSLANNYYTEDGWEDNTGNLITDVAEGVPGKQTEIYGDGTDKVNVMVYMCGSDLESQCGSATSDLKEMLNAEIGNQVNLIVLTGGSTKWQNNAISSEYNQIYQIKGGELFRLEKNFGSKDMTKSDTLAEFIQYCDKHFDANRNMLILWDHGGGSVEGYGHDEKYPYSGSMNLGGIKTALRNGGVAFDFVGFDACLMASVETGLAISDYSDYMIASEETEDASGWYYTNWLTQLSNNPGIGTVELGKIIADDFVRVASQNSPGVQSTLSVTDLVELKTTVPTKMQAFGKKVCNMIDGEQSSSSYSTVSKVRSKSREFGESYQIDQVDAVDFAQNMGNNEGKAFAKAVLGSVKYNKVSRNMTNAYGLSIYFPYANAQYASTVESVYNAIGICTEYTDAVQKYASLEMSGQFLSGGGSPFNSLFGLFGSGDYGNSYYGDDYSSDYSSLFDMDSLFGNSGSYGNSYSSNYSSNFFGGYDYNDYSTDYSTSDMSDLLGSLLGGGMFSQRTYTSKMNKASASEFLANNIFDQRQLEWKTNKDGQQIITLDDDQWRLVDHILLNVYYDDGEGLIDLGTDNVFDFDEEGNLIGENDKTWLSIDGNIVAYYYESTFEGADGYSITGYVPVMYNGQRAKMVLVFDSENPDGYIAGLRYDYTMSEEYIGVVAKVVGGVKAKSTDDEGTGLWENSFIAEDVSASIKEGDEIDFIADYYDYGGNYLDSYVIGSWTANVNPEIANMYVGDGTVLAMYSFTDIYNQTYWTAAME